MSGNELSSLERVKAELATLTLSARESVLDTQGIEVPAPEVAVELHPSAELSGPEKRVADARIAQQKMSQAGNALDKKLARAEETVSNLEKMADRLARMSEPQPANLDREALSTAVRELMELDGGAVFGPVLDAINQNVQELANGLEALRQTVNGLMTAQRESLPAAVSNGEFLFKTYGKDIIDSFAQGGPFDTYLSTHSRAYRDTLEGMFSAVDNAERADLVIEMDKYVAWMKTQVPNKTPGASTATVTPAPRVPVLTPGTPDSIPASAQTAGPGGVPSGQGDAKLLSQAEFDGYPMLMARAKTSAEKATLSARYAATVKAMVAQS